MVTLLAVGPAVVALYVARSDLLSSLRPDGSLTDSDRAVQASASALWAFGDATSFALLAVIAGGLIASFGRMIVSIAACGWVVYQAALIWNSVDADWSSEWPRLVVSSAVGLVLVVMAWTDFREVQSAARHNTAIWTVRRRRKVQLTSCHTCGKALLKN